MGITPWQKLIDKRTKNIGFLSKVNGFREPSEAEKAAALAKETLVWQESEGKKNYTLSAEYSNPLGSGTNLKATREINEPLEKEARYGAIIKYMETPMDKDGILKSQGVDIEKYENPPSAFKKAKDWVKVKIKNNQDLGLRYYEWLAEKLKEKK